MHLATLLCLDKNIYSYFFFEYQAKIKQMAFFLFFSSPLNCFGSLEKETFMLPVDETFVTSSLRDRRTYRLLVGLREVYLYILISECI